MATYTINIEFTFPLDENGNVDIHGTPTIENDPAQRDDVPGTDDDGVSRDRNTRPEAIR